jgi:hypothetical protein
MKTETDRLTLEVVAKPRNFSGSLLLHWAEPIVIRLDAQKRIRHLVSLAKYTGPCRSADVHMPVRGAGSALWNGYHRRRMSPESGCAGRRNIHDDAGYL